MAEVGKRVVLRKQNYKTRKIRERRGRIENLYRYTFSVRWDGCKWVECFPYWILRATGNEQMRILERG